MQIRNLIKYFWIILIFFTLPCYAQLQKEISKEIYKTVLDGDEVEIGDRASATFKPHLLMKRWKGETFLKVKSNLFSGTKSFSNGKIIYSTPAIDLKWYEVKNGIEYEIVLKQKPPINTISFPIETKDLVFYYQAPLNIEEANNPNVDNCTPTQCFKNGEVIIERPIDVVGSYAVYHAYKKDHIVGKTNYKAGKAFHIYRPKAIDANGKTVWGRFNKDLQQTKILAITIPQNFLDTAKYPVIIDPTFGYNTAGASYYSIEGFIIGSKFTMGATAGTADKLTIYVGASLTAKNSKGAVYTHGASSNSLLGVSAEISIPGDGAYAWRDYTMSSESLAASTDYVLTVWAAGGNGVARTRYDGGAAGQTHYESRAYGNYPDPWTTYTHVGYKVSIYCTYTETGGAYYSGKGIGRGIGGGVGR